MDDLQNKINAERAECCRHGPCSDVGDGCSCSDIDLIGRFYRRATEAVGWRKTAADILEPIHDLAPETHGWLVDEIARYLAATRSKALQEGREAMREEAARRSEELADVIPIWDRPGGPPGTGQRRPATPAEIAREIRALPASPSPKPEEG